MSEGRMHRLQALERLRKLREDQRRLDLSSSIQALRDAESACEEGAHTLQRHSMLLSEAAAEGKDLDVTRYSFLAGLIDVAQAQQERLEQAQEHSAQRVLEDAGTVAAAWKDHAAASRRHERHRQEWLCQLEKRISTESADLWLMRRWRAEHD